SSPFDSPSLHGALPILLDERVAPRVVDQLDVVVLVLLRLDADLDEALHRAGEELIVGAEVDDRLDAAEPTDELPDALGDPLHLRSEEHTSELQSRENLV